MLLNKLPVLDKGYVAIVDSCLNGQVLDKIQEKHFDGKINVKMFNVASLTLEIRCPIFFQVFLQQYDVKVVNVVEENIECYVPDISEIKTKDLQVNRDIADHMKQTTESLILTSEAFQKDGLDTFMSHSMIPVSVYNTVIVTASLRDWIDVICTRRKAPYAIQAYVDVINDAVEAEWPKLHKYIQGI